MGDTAGGGGEKEELQTNKPPKEPTNKPADVWTRRLKLGSGWMFAAAPPVRSGKGGEVITYT